MDDAWYRIEQHVFGAIERMLTIILAAMVIIIGSLMLYNGTIIIGLLYAAYTILLIILFIKYRIFV
jgi:hypothetical protein